jgi:hypothetical protein
LWLIANLGAKSKKLEKEKEKEKNPLVRSRDPHK